ncbi:MAG: elongation factor G [Pirellulaceae bacterium]|nr:elongation factor G [Pirellulaceae bacterium]
MSSHVQISNRRNIALCGHGSIGKTSLIDALLLHTGAIAGHHSVDDGTSVCDFDPEEKLHKHTIEAKVVHLQSDSVYFTFLDTPGYTDCIGQTIGALVAADGAVIGINAHKGIEVNTRRVFKEVLDLGMPVSLVITRVDGEAVDFGPLMQQIRDTFGPSCVLMNLPKRDGELVTGIVDLLEPGDDLGAVMEVGPLHDQLVEALVEGSDVLMERYLDGDIPSIQELLPLLPDAVLSRELIPVFCVDARDNIGLSEFLRGLAQTMPSPDRIERHGSSTEGQDVVLHADASGPLVAQVFKTRVDPYLQKLSYIRVFNGTLKKDQLIHVDGDSQTIKIPTLLEVQAGQTQPLDYAEAGQIVAVAKVDALHTGSVLGDVRMPEIHFPQPMVGLAIRPKTQADEKRLSVALHKLVEEDPTIRLDRDSLTSEVVLTGMSELHLKLLLERMQHRDKVDLETHDPRIPLRETIQIQAEGSYRHKKQSGGRGQFGEVHIRMYPFPRGTAVEDFATKSRFPSLKAVHHDAVNNFLWIDSVVGGSIPGNFLPAIEKGFKERIVRGVIAGYPIQDVAVEVHYGKHHPVDSSEAAFKIAGAMAFKQVFLESQPCLLEPLVKLDVSVPESHVGDVYGDMSSRGGRVLGTDSGGGDIQVVHCIVPLREVMHYGRTLSSMTGGQGSYSIEFSSYEVMPPNAQQQYLQTVKAEDEVESLLSS